MSEREELNLKKNLTNEDKSYIIKLEKFEGPLDLLLYLIKKAEIDIYDIPIHEITEQYLRYLQLMKRLDINITAEFLVMAAKLMYIKSKMLLPVESDIEDEYFEDPRTELVHQLLEYQKFKEAAKELEDRHLSQTYLYFRMQNQIKFDFFDDNDNWVDIKLIDLINIFNKLINDTRNENLEFYVPDTVTVGMKIDEILNILEEKEEIDFSDLFKDEIKVSEIVVTFLAILELVKIRKISIKQHRLFGDIRIFRKELNNEPIN